MPLSNGRPTRALPGPSIIPDRVLNAMHRAAPNIYAGDLVEMTDRITAGLKEVARTSGQVAIYMGNGHAAWEAGIVNILAPGDKALVLVTGRFGFGWADTASALGVDVELIDFGSEAPADPARLEARLRADRTHEIRAVLTVQTDTASSTNNDIPALRAAIDAAGHPALLAVDCIASLACERYEMDAWGVDVTVAASQKGLMTPPGVSFTYANEKALARRREIAGPVSPYFDWLPRFAPKLFYHRFCGTPPTHHLFGLNEALAMIAEEGLENVWARHEALAAMVWAAVEAWGEVGTLRLNVRDRAARSVAVTTILAGGEDGSRLQAWCEREAGVTLGIGLGLGAAKSPPSDAVFRIGHMGHLNLPTMMGTLGSIDAGLKALGIAHGGGALRAASDVAAAHLATPPAAAAPALAAAARG